MPTPPPSALENLDTLGSALGSFATIVALILGGIWTYYKFIKDRVYSPRLEVSMDAGAVTIDGKRNLLCALSVKNIGTSNVALAQEGTGFRLTEGAPATDPFLEPHWGDSRVFAIFEEHEWIESGETIREQRFVALPQDGERAMKLETRLVCKRRNQNVTVYGCAVVSSNAEWKGNGATKEEDDGDAANA